MGMGAIDPLESMTRRVTSRHPLVVDTQVHGRVHLFVGTSFALQPQLWAKPKKEKKEKDIRKK